MNNIPWVEKYRPQNFENIILNNENRILFNEIINKNIFPNILLYGPPGTGKTTTIINIINKFQELNNEKDYKLVIKHSIVDAFFSILSFGLYTPTTIIIYR